jgi:hypothetical protein
MRRTSGRQRSTPYERSRPVWLWGVLGLAFFTLGTLLYAAERPEAPSEAQVKAAYLYNFGKFVRWPAPPATPTFDICVLGKNPFGPALSNIVSGERIQGKNIVARNLPTFTEALHCQIVYIPASEEGRMKAAFAVAKHNNTLTVSDIPEFAEHGGMIGLVNVGGRIRFEVNVGAVNEAGMSVSSELLKVAIKVIGMDQTKETGR